MIPDMTSLLAIVARVERGTATAADANILLGVVIRLDEMDDLVDTVCSCRTQEIPIYRPYAYDDVPPGERP